MSTDLFSDKSFNLSQALLYPTTGSGSQTDITYLIVELNLFEDIFATAVSGNVILNDSLDLVSKIPIIGFEYLTLVFAKPGGSSVDKISKTFRVYKLDHLEHDHASQSNQTYRLLFCSEELILSTASVLGKSYKGMMVKDSIKDILVNKLKTKKRFIFDNKLTGKFDYRIPNWRPLNAASWLAAKTVPPSLFYENLQGYNLKTIKNLLDKSTNPVVRSFFFAPQNVVMPNDSIANDMSNVIRYEFMEVFDILDGINSGMFSGSILALDPLRRSRKITEFKNPIFSNQSKDRLSKTLQDETGGYRRTRISTTYHDTDPNIKDHQPGINPNLVENHVLQRASSLEQLAYFRVKVVVPGDATMSVGNLVNFGMPSMGPKNPNASSSTNPYWSGRYLVTALRHKITPKSWETIMELSLAALGAEKKTPQASNDSGFSKYSTAT